MRIFSVFLILTVFLLNSCEAETESDNQTSEQASPNKDTSTLETSSPYRHFDPQSGPTDTKYNAPFEQELPADFFLDTLTFRKEEKKASYTVCYLQSNDPEKEDFNQFMLTEILANIEWDAQFVDDQDPKEAIETVYWYSLEPFEFYMDDRLISMCYVIDAITHGGNHHNYSWFTINYDLKSNAQLTFQDVFYLPDVEDSMYLSTSIATNLTGCKSEIEGYLDNMDFSFVEKGIVMNPYLSWSCGMQRSLLRKDSAYAFINEKWR